MRNSTEIKAELEKVQNAGIRMNNLQNEGARDGYDFTDRRREEALIAELQAAIIVEEWSLEQTQAKRIIWNDIVKTAQKAGRPNLMKMQQTAGFRMPELREAIKRHSL